MKAQILDAERSTYLPGRNLLGKIYGFNYASPRIVV